MDTESKASRPVAVVEIGSTGIRMVVAEIDGSGGWKVLDRAGMPVPLGRDVFTSGNVSRDVAAQCLNILRGFREVLRSWGLGPGEVACIATSALREARNRDTFMDRVHLQTGFKVNTVEGIEEIRLMHLGILYALKDMRGELGRSNTMVLEVGGGSTEIMLLRRNRILAAHSLGVGTVRIQQQVAETMGSSRYLIRFLEENISTTCERLTNELKLDTIKYCIWIGSDARIVAEFAGRRVQDTYSVIARADFMDFVERHRHFASDELVEKLHLAYSEAEGLVPGILIARLFMDRTEAEEIIVPDVSIREGMLINIAQGGQHEEETDFHSQVIASAMALGRKYHFDEKHGSHVTELSLKLFDALTELHGLDGHERLLLETAGLLHDVGTYIKTSGHHKHSEYIVANSEIFGLRTDDLAVVANAVRYHRKQTPSSAHINYSSLPPDLRIVVLKLSAILRVADALDRGHTQTVHIERVESVGNSLIIYTSPPADLSLERFSLIEKANLFEDVFGLKVTLV
jgi:exopolyphosphatase/guanosine-5'-triphosphate,3'-diphosphate pyrophosphatase